MVEFVQFQTSFGTAGIHCFAPNPAVLITRKLPLSVQISGNRLWFASPATPSFEDMSARARKTAIVKGCNRGWEASDSWKSEANFVDDNKRMPLLFSRSAVPLLQRRGFLVSSAALMLLSFVTSPNQLAYSQSEYNKTNSPNVIGHGAGAQTKVGKNRAWSDLSETEREAARFLGFDAESWDTDSKVYIDRLTWEELSPAQRKAAKTLSFNKKTWNDDGKPYEAARMPLHTRVQSIIARAVEINVGMLIFLPVAFAHCDLNP